MPSTDQDFPLDLIEEAFCEYLLRIDQGESIDEDAFLARFPEVAADLKMHLRTDSTVRRLAGPTFAESQASVDCETAIVTESRDETSGKKVADWGIPEEFGRYRVKKLLGQGAMGAVYLARDTQLDRDVALKIPKFNQQVETELLERFYREARAVATLHHPNICPVYDVGEIDGQTFLSMAFIQGRPLDHYTKSSSRQTERSAAKLVRQLAVALQEAHDIGVVHRDLKPANIMVGKKGEPVVMDFGLARRMDSGDVRVTQSGAILGTPAYMSPEQVEGNPESIGPASDQYSLGVILYELLTGELPFRGTLLSVIGQIAHKAPRGVVELCPDIDPRIAAICTRMMSKQAEDRYEDMAAAAAALNDYLIDSKTADGSEDQSVWDVDLTKSRAGTRIIPKGSPRVSPAAIRRNRSCGLVGGVTLGFFVMIAAVVIYFQTPNGTVRIEIADPEIQVEFAGQTMTIDDAGAAIEVVPGPHSMKVRRGPLWFTSRKFTVEKNGKVVIEVTWQDGELVAKNGSETLLKEKLPRETASSVIKVPPETSDALPTVTKIEQPNDKFVLVRKLKGPKSSGNTNALAVSDDGKWLVFAGGKEGTVWLWDLETWESAGIFDPHRSVNSVDITRDARLVVDSEYSSRISLWERKTGKLIRSHVAHAKASVTVVKFTPDGKTYVSAGSAGGIKVWDTESGEELRHFDVSGYRRILRIAPGGKQVLTSSEFPTICHLDTGEIETASTMKFANSFAFSKDGQLLLCGNTDGKVTLWDFNKRLAIREFVGQELKDFGSVEFLPNEKHVVSGCSDGSIRLWETATGREVARIEGLGSLASCVLPLPDGRHVLSTGGQGDEYQGPFKDDYDIRVWQLPETVWPGPDDGLNRTEQHVKPINKADGRIAPETGT